MIFQETDFTELFCRSTMRQCDDLEALFIRFQTGMFGGRRKAAVGVNTIRGCLWNLNEGKHLHVFVMGAMHMSSLTDILT